MTREEDGRALLEVLLVGLVLLVPLIWVLGILADLHRTALGVTAAAREGVVRAARAADVGDASHELTRAVREALVDHGVDPIRAQVVWEMPEALPRGATVWVEVASPVPVSQAPFLGKVAGPAIWVRAASAARVDLYRSRE